ncbi:MAG: lipoyl(octanoyl) transferase LipB [Sphingobacteriaceae bacterium]|nr:lipoyl(octanoyl) transferase LipB [Sphingobacteriaceae bacterium]
MIQNKNVICQDWGLTAYEHACQKQAELFDATVAMKIKNRNDNSELETPNYLIFCEHPPVYTLGKSGLAAHLLLNQAELSAQGVSFHQTNRGGDITHHGPGQIVGYPILDLDNFFTDIHLYLRQLEEAIILTLADYGLKAGRYQGYTGVWLDADNAKARKICAMGVRCSRWVTMHGFALNVNNDLSYFNHIVPCGIVDKAVTSLAQELGHEVAMDEVKTRIKKHLATLFEMNWSTETSTPQS